MKPLMISLNSGTQIPSEGFGTFLISNDGPCYEAVLNALKCGYRHIDTAAGYGNETDVAKAIKDSGLKREDVFITSKLWVQDNSYEGAKYGIEQSLKNLDTDYIDLYLIHQPYGDSKGAWKAMEEAVDAGKLKAIGISNQTPKIFESFIKDCRILPGVNQVECNPTFQQKELRKIMEPYGIVVEAWYPLGHGNKELLSNPLLQEIAKKHNKSTVQVILRWLYQEGIVSLPKSLNPEHMATNLDIQNFELSQEDMDAIRTLDTGKGTHDPEDPAVEKRLTAIKIHE